MPEDARLADSASSGVRRRRASRYRRARRWVRKRLRWPVLLALGALVALGLVILGAAAWRDVRPVRGELEAARSSLQQAVEDPGAWRTTERRAATAGQIEGALRTVRDARRRVDRSLAVDIARFIPLVSRQRSGLLEIMDDAETGARVGTRLLERVQELDEGGQIREGVLPFDDLGVLANALRDAGQRIRPLVRSADGLWGELGEARRKLNRVAGPMSARLLDGADALDVARGFLGADGRRRHLVAMQNNAEMRDQGMVLSYAVVSADESGIRFDRSGNIGDLRLDRPVATPIPEGTQAMFGYINPTTIWQSVNATADFAWSGRVMADMYQEKTGEPVDGVIAIDVPGLAALLRVVGPVNVEGVPEAISADNVGRVLLHDLYEGLSPTSDQGPRRERLADVTGVVIERLTGGAHDAVGLGRELGEAAAGGHFKLWSSRPDEERVFERIGLGGGPGLEDPERTFHVAVQNRTSTKLDYFVHPTVRMEVQLTEDGGAFVRTTVVIDNQAPVGAAPSYQLGPDPYTEKPGDYSAWVLVWGPAGATQAASVQESGLTLTEGIVTVAAGEQREVVIDTLIPGAVRDEKLLLRLVPQPRLVPVHLTVQAVGDGWGDGAPSWEGPWDRTRTIEWEVRL